MEKKRFIPFDAESKLGKLGKCFQRDEKMRF